MPLPNRRSSRMIRFKVFGVDPTLLDRYGKMINDSMQGHDVKYDIEHVVDVDQFIQYGITSIPSLVVHTEVKFEEKDLDPERFTQAVRDLTGIIKHQDDH